MRGKRRATGVKVLHVLPSLSASWGGPVSVVLGLTRALEQRAVNCSVLATYGVVTGPKPSLPSSISAAVFKTDLLGWLWFGHAPGLAAAMREQMHSCDLVHIHELWHYPHWIAARVAIESRVPYVVSPHGEFSAWALRQKRVAKRAYAPILLWPSLRRTNAIHALSEAEVQQVRDFGVSAPVHLIPNGVPVDLTQTDRDKRASVQMFSELRDRAVVLFLGRLQPQKGPDVLVEAWSHLARQCPTAHLLLAGPADARMDAALKARAQELGLTASITFAGPLYGARKAAAMAGADLFVLPSRSEGQSVALLEALAAGLPVVVTPPANFPDVGVADVGVVAPLEPAALAKAMLELLSQPDRATAMGARGRDLVRQRFTWPRVAAQVQEMYERVLHP